MKFLAVLSLVLITSLTCPAQFSLDKEKLFTFYQNQHYSEAAAYLNSLYPNGTDDVKVLSQLAYCNLMAGQLVEAEKNYLKIDTLQPNQTPILFNLANINSRRGNTKNAAVYLEQVIAIDSNNFNALKQLANYTDSLKLKVSYLEKANKLNSGEADVAYDLAFAYRKLKLNQQAYNILKTAIAADTGNLVLQQALLPIANLLKKYDEVLVIGKKLLENEADANVVLDVGKAYFFLKDYQKAIELFQLLEKASMQNETTLYYTMLCYRELKNYEMAANYTKRTINEGISPNVAAYYNILGGIYEDKKQFTQAAVAYKKALGYSVHKNTYYRLGLLYDLKLKRSKDALNYYQLYLKSKDLEGEDQPQVDYVTARVKALTRKN